MTQEGMKRQLNELHTLVKFIDPQLCNYLGKLYQHLSKNHIHTYIDTQTTDIIHKHIHIQNTQKYAHNTQNTQHTDTHIQLKPILLMPETEANKNISPSN